VTPPTKTKALYIPPGGPRRAPARPALTTFRLTLTNEATGEVLHEWQRIPRDRVMPILQGLRRIFAASAFAVQAKQTWDRLMELFE
jgi:hypothetical protein